MSFFAWANPQRTASALSRSLLIYERDPSLRMDLDLPEDLFTRSVGGASFYEYQLGIGPNLGTSSTMRPIVSTSSWQGQMIETL